MTIIYKLETDILELNTTFTNEQEAIIASYHYPEFIVNMYFLENGKERDAGYFYKGGIKKTRV
jgi:hypothetical protein